MLKGYHKSLTFDDLDDIPKNLKTEELYPDFSNHLNQYLKR